MKLTTNLASESYHRTRLFRLFFFLLSLVLAGTGGLQIRSYLLWQDEYRQLEEDLQKVQADLYSVEEELRALGVDVSDSGLASFRSQVDSYNGLIAEKAFSWTLLLSELEEAVPGNISVTRLQPHFPNRLMILNGQALSLKDLTRLIIQLEDAAAFEQVFLKDQKTNHEGFVDFTIEFKYRSQKQSA